MRKSVLFDMGLSLLRALEFFVFRKMEMPETKIHLRVESSRYTKNHLSVTIELFRHYCKKGELILWRIRIMTWHIQNGCANITSYSLLSIEENYL